jgi:hypothetical protein
MPESREQLLIGGKPTVLAEKLPLLEQDPQTDVVQVQGAPEAPSLLVAATDPAHVEELKEKLGDDVIVEPNFPIEPL